MRTFAIVHVAVVVGVIGSCGGAVYAFDLNDTMKTLRALQLDIGKVLAPERTTPLVDKSFDQVIEMRKLLKTEFILKEAILTIYGEQTKAIYGLDDRVNFQGAVSIEQQAASATVLVTRSANVFKNPATGTVVGEGQTYDLKTSSPLCTDAQVDTINKSGVRTSNTSLFSRNTQVGFVRHSK